jgi:hypothetical protein
MVPSMRTSAGHPTTTSTSRAANKERPDRTATRPLRNSCVQVGSSRRRLGSPAVYPRTAKLARSVRHIPAACRDRRRTAPCPPRPLANGSNQRPFSSKPRARPVGSRRRRVHLRWPMVRHRPARAGPHATASPRGTMRRLGRPAKPDTRCRKPEPCQVLHPPHAGDGTVAPIGGECQVLHERELIR